jgi:hypothetical protein
MIIIEFSLEEEIIKSATYRAVLETADKFHSPFAII